MAKEHFLFGCAFLEVDGDLKDLVELFEVLDESADGHLTEDKFSLIFDGVDSWNSHNHNIMNSILRDSRLFKLGLRPSGNIDLSLAHNTAEKLPYNAHDIHIYPHFFGKKVSRIVESRNHDFTNTQIINPPSTNRKRTLSIMDKHGKIMSPGKSRRSRQNKAEYNRAKNQSTLMPSTEEFDLGGALHKTHENRSNRRIREDKGVDQIWTSESIVANAMANERRQKTNFSSIEDRTQPILKPTFIKQLI